MMRVEVLMPNCQLAGISSHIQRLRKENLDRILLMLLIKKSKVFLLSFQASNKNMISLYIFLYKIGHIIFFHTPDEILQFLNRKFKAFTKLGSLKFKVGH